jgi:hypothetical protein
MAEHHGNELSGPTEEQLKDSIAAGYEKSDVSIHVLLQWGGGLGVFLVVTAAAMLILFSVLQRPPFAPGPSNESILRTQRIEPPSGTPIVQDNPAGDPRPDNNPRKGIDSIREFRREEEIRINEYAKQDGNIHIPIDRAMELTLKNFRAQMPGEAPTGVSPTPEMKLHPSSASTSTPADGAQGAPPPSAAPSSNR